MRYPVPGPAGPAGPKGGSVSTKTFNETQCARRATSSINSPCLVSYFGSNQKKVPNHYPEHYLSTYTLPIAKILSAINARMGLNGFHIK